MSETPEPEEFSLEDLQFDAPDSEDSDPQVNPNHTRNLIIGVAVAAALTIAGGFAWHSSSESRAFETAKQDYQSAIQSEDAEFSSLTKEIDRAEGLLDGCEKKVEDKELCSALSSATEGASEIEGSIQLDLEESSRQAVEDATTAVESNVSDISQANELLSKSSDDVEGSISAKKLSQAHKGLKDAVSQSKDQAASTQKLIDQTADKVADNSTRTSAKEKVNELNALVKESEKLFKGDDVDKVSKQEDALTSKMKEVKKAEKSLESSHSQWEEAQAEQESLGSSNNQASADRPRSTSNSSGAQGSPSSNAGPNSGASNSQSSGNSSSSGSKGSRASGSAGGSSNSGSSGSSSSGSSSSSSSRPSAPWTASSQDAILNASVGYPHSPSSSCSAIGSVKSIDGAQGILGSAAHRSIVKSGSYVSGRVYAGTDPWGDSVWWYEATVFGCAK